MAQGMNNDIYSMTPGSAMADTLEEILTNKRLEARQAMLDSIHSQDVQSQIAYRDENARSLAQQRDARAAELKSKQLQEYGGMLNPHQDLSPQGVQRLTDLGGQDLIDPATPSTPQFDYEGQPDLPGHGPQFHGQAKQLETERALNDQKEAQQQLMDLFKQDDGKGNVNPALVEILSERAFHRSLPAGSLRQNGKVYSLDEDTNRLIDPVTRKPVDINSIGPYDKIERITRTPRIPQEHGIPYEHPVIGPDGQVDKTKIFVMKNGKLVVENAPAGYSVGEKVTPTTEARRMVVPPVMVKELDRLRGAITPKGGWGSSSTPDPQALKAYKSARNNVINNFGTTPTVKFLAPNILDMTPGEKAASPTLDDILEHQGISLSDDERSDLQQILNRFQ